jgi:signal peptidase I
VTTDWVPVVAPRDDRGLPRFAPRGGRGRKRGALAESVRLVVLALAIAIATKSVVAQPFFIPSDSMVSQLETGDRVVVSKLAYRLHDPRRGDIVVFDSPDPAPPAPAESLPGRLWGDLLEAIGLRQPPQDVLIKRVIALPGETVEGRDGHVYVEGQLLVEPYLDPDDPETETSSFPPTVVPQGHVWVMGDHRCCSRDSRSFGPVDEDEIVGRALYRLWPPWRIAFL